MVLAMARELGVLAACRAFSNSYDQAARIKKMNLRFVEKRTN